MGKHSYRSEIPGGAEELHMLQMPSDWRNPSMQLLRSRFSRPPLLDTKVRTGRGLRILDIYLHFLQE